ncbi:MAG: hypothetical protein AAF539_15145, partial [Planctomycetota bacterium]
KIASWKKAIVALAGPVPSLVIATLCLLLGVGGRDSTSLTTLAGLMWVLNVLNLLPLLPLDGGWILQLTLFRRSPAWQWIARVTTVVIMGIAGWWMADPILLLIAIPLALAIPMTIRVARLIQQIDASTIASPEHDEIPREAIEALDAKMKTTSMGELRPSARAAWIIHIYESIVVPPPRFRESVAILSMYGASWVLALAGGGALWTQLRSRTADPSMTDWLVMPVPHQVTVDADSMMLHLGQLPKSPTTSRSSNSHRAIRYEQSDVPEMTPDDQRSGLAILQTDSKEDLLLAIDSASIGPASDYSVVVGDRLMLASLPLPQMSEQDLESPWSQMQPSPIENTWLAPLASWLDEHPEASMHVLTGLFSESVEIRVVAPSHELASRWIRSHFQSARTAADQIEPPVWAADPDAQNRYAAHISGTCKPESTEMTLHVHRACDMAATIAGWIRWLHERDCQQFELRYLAAGHAASK